MGLPEIEEARFLYWRRQTAKLLMLTAYAGMNAMRGRVFTYDSREWSRLAAWQHLTTQQIPGAPQLANTSRVPWRKAHDAARHEWAWIYVG